MLLVSFRSSFSDYFMSEISTSRYLGVLSELNTKEFFFPLLIRWTLKMHLTKMCGIKNENPNLKKKRFLPVTAKGQDSRNIKDRKKKESN